MGTRLLLAGQLMEPAAPGGDGLALPTTAAAKFLASQQKGARTFRNPSKNTQNQPSGLLQMYNQMFSHEKTMTISDSLFTKLPRLLEQV